MVSDDPHPSTPSKGDVIPASIRRVSGTPCSDDGLIEMDLIGHPHRYRVRVDTRGAAPKLLELHLVPGTESDAEINPATIRAVPVRRLAAAAARFIGIDELPFAVAGDLPDDDVRRRRPDYRPGARPRDDTHFVYISQLLTRARALGLSPREHVAAEMGVSIPTVDRWIKEAKNRGHLPGDWSNNNGHRLR